MGAHSVRHDPSRRDDELSLLYALHRVAISMHATQTTDSLRLFSSKLQQPRNKDGHTREVIERNHNGHLIERQSAFLA